MASSFALRSSASPRARRTDRARHEVLSRHALGLCGTWPSTNHSGFVEGSPDSGLRAIGEFSQHSPGAARLVLACDELEQGGPFRGGLLDRGSAADLWQRLEDRAAGVGMAREGTGVRRLRDARRKPRTQVLLEGKDRQSRVNTVQSPTG